MATRILLVDDSAAFREGFGLLAGSLPDLEVVGTAASGTEALRQVERLQPDVVVMDLHMPGVGGIEATRRIRATSPHVRVLVLTMLEDDDSVLTAMRAGASGYLVKGATQAEIARAIGAVAAGEVIFGPAVARRVLDDLLRPVAAVDPFPDLTQRERELLDLVAAGATNAAIASGLGISVKTVRNHLTSIFTKLQVADRGGAIVKAREVGFGERGRPH